MVYISQSNAEKDQVYNSQQGSKEKDCIMRNTRCASSCTSVKGTAVISKYLNSLSSAFTDQIGTASLNR